MQLGVLCTLLLVLPIPRNLEFVKFLLLKIPIRENRCLGLFYQFCNLILLSEDLGICAR